MYDYDYDDDDDEQQRILLRLLAYRSPTPLADPLHSFFFFINGQPNAEGIFKQRESVLRANFESCEE